MQILSSLLSCYYIITLKCLFALKLFTVGDAFELTQPPQNTEDMDVKAWLFL